MRSLSEEDLENLMASMMLNSPTDFEIHWDVTIKLIDVVRIQQAAIERLRKEVSSISTKLNGLSLRSI